MKQKIKRVFLVLSMAVCLLALSACGKKEDVSDEPVPQNVIDTIKAGAETYLIQFDKYDDAAIENQKKRLEKQGDTVLVSALDTWKNLRDDLGSLSSENPDEYILSEKVVRVDEDSYQITITVSYEKREMDFLLTAEEAEPTGSEDYIGGTPLVPTELIFNPHYTTGEKLSKAFMNTIMGMCTVFAVLIFISFIISQFKRINEWEAKKQTAKTEKENAARQAKQNSAPTVSTPKVQAPGAPAPVAPVPAAEPVPEPEIVTEENLTDDLELVAVITAAIAATASVPAEGLVVRSIRRKSAAKWKNA